MGEFALNIWDIFTVLVFYLAVYGISLWKSRREKSAEGYFLASRSLPWWIIGISIVAANISTEQFVGMAGQAAGLTGLAVSNWQLVGTVGIVLIAFALVPKFLEAGIKTMPEFLELRYDSLARTIMALETVVIYVAVLTTAVVYSGALTLKKIFDIPLVESSLAIGLLAGIYTLWGGLKAVAWADLLQGLALLIGGMITFFIGLSACGGWLTFVAENRERLHMILPADHPQLPWTGVIAGMWIVILYYCGLNQFIVQRNLAARSLRDGQLGMIFAGALWLLVPFAIVMPGIIARQLFPAELANPDEAFPLLIRRLVPSGLRGLMLAAIGGAVVSSLASMLNSAATILTFDFYLRWIRPSAKEHEKIWFGRIATAIFLMLACFFAPKLQDPKFGGVFQFIQQFQGYIWCGVASVFLFGLLVPTAPRWCGSIGLIGGPVFYGLFQILAPSIHFLIQVSLSFELTIGLMALVTLLWPASEPWRLPRLRELELNTDPVVTIAGVAVLTAVVGFYIIFM